MTDDRSRDPANFPIWDRGPGANGFAVGTEIEHHWARTFQQAESTLFASVTCWWNPVLLDASAAVAAGYDEPIIHPYLVLCTVFGLSVEDLSESRGPFLGLNECEFLAPVYAGDTLTAHSTVLACRDSAQRPTARIVSWRTEGHNQRGEVVLRYERTNLVDEAPSRGAAK